MVEMFINKQNPSIYMTRKRKSRKERFRDMAEKKFVENFISVLMKIKEGHKCGHEIAKQLKIDKKNGEDISFTSEGYISEILNHFKEPPLNYIKLEELRSERGNPKKWELLEKGKNVVKKKLEGGKKQHVAEMESQQNRPFPQEVVEDKKKLPRTERNDEKGEEDTEEQGLVEEEEVKEREELTEDKRFIEPRIMRFQDKSLKPDLRLLSLSKILKKLGFYFQYYPLDKIAEKLKLNPKDYSLDELIKEVDLIIQQNPFTPLSEIMADKSFSISKVYQYNELIESLIKTFTDEEEIELIKEATLTIYCEICMVAIRAGHCDWFENEVEGIKGFKDKSHWDILRKNISWKAMGEIGRGKIIIEILRIVFSYCFKDKGKDLPTNCLDSIITNMLVSSYYEGNPWYEILLLTDVHTENNLKHIEKKLIDLYERNEVPERWQKYLISISEEYLLEDVFDNNMEKEDSEGGAE